MQEFVAYSCLIMSNPFVGHSCIIQTSSFKIALCNFERDGHWNTDNYLSKHLNLLVVTIWSLLNQMLIWLWGLFILSWCIEHVAGKMARGRLTTNLVFTPWSQKLVCICLLFVGINSNPDFCLQYCVYSVQWYSNCTVVHYSTFIQSEAIISQPMISLWIWDM